jgi:rhodanese-related sulfurtransferase
MRTTMILVCGLLSVTAAACGPSWEDGARALARAEAAGARAYAPTELAAAREALERARSGESEEGLRDALVLAGAAEARAVEVAQSVTRESSSLRALQEDGALETARRAEARESRAQERRSVALPEGTPVVTPLAVEEARKVGGGWWLVDVRSPQAYARGHAAGAMRLSPLELAHVQVPAGTRLALYADGDDNPVLSEAVRALRGRDFHAYAVVVGGLAGWLAAGLAHAGEPPREGRVATESVTPAALHDLLASPGRAPVVLDTRSVTLHAAGRVPGSVHADLASLRRWSGRLPGDRPAVVYGADEASTRRAAEVLVRAGVTTTRRLEGGLGGWVASGYALETSTRQVSVLAGEAP